MRRIAKLCQLEFKNAFRCMLMTTGILMLVVSILAVSALIFINNTEDEQGEKMVIGVVINDTEDNIFASLISFANGISSLKNFCRLEIFDESEGFDSLKNDEIKLLMVVPEGFMDAAEHMQETSFMVYMNHETGPGEGLILSLFNGVEEIMLSTEGAILAMYDGMDAYEVPVSRVQMQDDMMELFIRDFLGRDMYFDVQYLSPYGVFSVVQYYVIAILLMIVLLCGAMYFRVYSRESERLESVMFGTLRIKWLAGIVKIISMAIPLMLQMWLILIAGKILYGIIDMPYTYFGAQAFLITGIIALSEAAIIHLIAMIPGDKTGRVITYLVIIILMMVTSGTIGSRYYLPDFLRHISGYYPVSAWHQMLLGTLWGDVEASMVLIWSVFALILLFVGNILYLRRLNTHG